MRQCNYYCCAVLGCVQIIGYIMVCLKVVFVHDDVIKWKQVPRYWPFVWGIHRSPVNSPHKGQWRGALMFSLIWDNWVNNREAGDLRRHRAHYDVIVMFVFHNISLISYHIVFHQIGSMNQRLCRVKSCNIHFEPLTLSLPSLRTRNVPGTGLHDIKLHFPGVNYQLGVWYHRDITIMISAFNIYVVGPCWAFIMTLATEMLRIAPNLSQWIP